MLQLVREITGNVSRVDEHKLASCSRHFIMAAASGVAIAFSQPVWSQEGVGASDDLTRLNQNWQLSLNFENDVFYGQDSGYSTGLRLVGSRNEDPNSDIDLAEARSPFTLKLLRKVFPDALGAEFVSSTSRGAGFSIFTPQDNDAPDDERPYGGYLYGLYNVQRFFDEITGAGNFIFSTDHYEDIEVQLGWMGPHTYMEQLITGFHEIWPRGGSTEDWPGRQIEDSPAINLFYTRVWSGNALPGLRQVASDNAREERSSQERNFGVVPRTAAGKLEARKRQQLEKTPQYYDFRPFAGFAAGNVYDYASAGTTARLGWNIPTTTIGPPLVRPGPPGTDRFEPQPWNRPALYGFAGLEGRFVLYDAFLDGNTRDDSRNVDKKYFVGDFQYGVALEWRFFRVAYNRVMRSALYDGQGTTSFGSINLTAVMPF